MELIPQKSPDSLRSEHLNKGIKPIMVCVGSYNDYGYFEKYEINRKFSERRDDVHNVNYYATSAELKRKNFLNSRANKYVISTIDDRNKFSESFIDCTGLIVSGKDKITGENISFLTHQSPSHFLDVEKDNFIYDLKQSLKQIQDRCVSGTIDAVILGGIYLTGTDNTSINSRKKYLDSIELISKEVQQVLDFKPVVVNGPKTEGGFDNVYFENEKKRVYFLREGKINSTTNSFNESDIEEEKNKWGEW